MSRTVAATPWALGFSLGIAAGIGACGHAAEYDSTPRSGDAHRTTTEAEQTNNRQNRQPPGGSRAGKRSASRAWLKKVAAAAHWHLDRRPAIRRRDCSGLVGAVLERAGVVAQGSSRTYWTEAIQQGRLVSSRTTPLPGMLAVFDRTYDANGNGKDDDEVTHIAVVVDVQPDGTIVMVHWGSGRIKALRMNLKHRTTHRHGGRVVNDYLRSPKHGAGDGPRLAAQLLRGFALPPGGSSQR